MTTFSVTATQGGSPANGMVLRVVVLTQAALTQNGATANTQFASTTTHTLSITTTQTGSAVYGAASHSPQKASTAAALTTVLDDIADAGNGEEYVTFKATSLTGTPGATTLGYTTTAATVGPLAMLEVLTAGTLTEDASGGSNSTLTAQTIQYGPFTPPPGALLVALIGSNGSASQVTMSVTDNSGLGLTWTQAVVNNPNAGDYAGVWFAQMPGGGGAPLPELPGSMFPPLSRTFGPNAPFDPWSTYPVITAAVTSGPPVYPLLGPVRSRITPPPRGRNYSNAGVFNQVGPPFRPDSSPVASGSTSAAASSRNGARLPARGRTASNAGIRGQLGPQVYPLQHPVAAVTRPLPPRGRTYSRSGTFGQLGPQFFAQPKPLQARRPLPPRGRNYARVGIFGQLGPPVYPLLRPVAAVTRPLPPRGRTGSNPGIRQQTGPQVYPLLRPVAAALPPRTVRGICRTNIAIPFDFVPPLPPPLRGPVQARKPLPPRGRTAASSAAAPAAPPPNLTVIYPPGRPVAAVVRPLPPRGRTYSRTGIYGQLGPPVAPLQQPAGVRRILQRQGSAQADAGPIGILGPPVYPLLHPVQARRPLPARGRVSASFAPAPVTPPPNLTAYYPLGHPAAAVSRPLPRRGRTSSNVGIRQQTGPAFFQLNHPVKAAQPLPPRGRTAARYGVFTATVVVVAPFYPLDRPAAAATRPRPPRGRNYSNAGVFNQVGPPVKALQHPVMAFRNPIRPGYGVTSIRVAPPATLGPPVYPLRRPVRAPYPQLHPRAGGATAHTLPYVAPFIAPGGHGYPYTAVLTADRWPAQMRRALWSASAGPGRYEAIGLGPPR